ncbi:hypothetical protein Tco_0992918 [Tanacetum coccineum]|uniref:Uncharacterized protein n=1 Tax=Tanacetum coccineum TaxID=301880 RepID=A0ABQ5F4D4_9ASTR
MRELLHLLVERNPFYHLKLHQNPSLAKAHTTPLHHHQVEFKRISLTGFRSCTSRSRYLSVSKQTTRIATLSNRVFWVDPSGYGWNHGTKIPILYRLIKRKEQQLGRSLTKIHIDNKSTICVVKNPVFHSITKHIEIRHHFIRDSNEKKLIQMIKIHTDQNVADLLTKAFDVSRFEYLIASIGMLNL